MSDSNECFFCAENTLEHTYKCCKKQCCVNCYDKFYSINKKCPWCRQDPKMFNHSENSNKNTYNNIILYFENWLNENNIKRSDYVNRCIDHINSIDLCFQNKDTDIIEFQVANHNKIHVFKYNDYKQLSFKYWKDSDSIEVTGGNYYKYDIYHNSDNFGWWLHGFIKVI
jgi:hypothetical protein